MENKRPSAIFDHREYFYTLVSKSPTEIRVSLYSTDYILVIDKDGHWINHQSNKNAMAKGLIKAIIAAVSE